MPRPPAGPLGQRPRPTAPTASPAPMLCLMEAEGLLSVKSEDGPQGKGCIRTRLAPHRLSSQGPPAHLQSARPSRSGTRRRPGPRAAAASRHLGPHPRGSTSDCSTHSQPDQPRNVLRPRGDRGAPASTPIGSPRHLLGALSMSRGPRRNGPDGLGAGALGGSSSLSTQAGRARVVPATAPFLQAQRPPAGRSSSAAGCCRGPASSISGRRPATADAQAS